MCRCTHPDCLKGCGCRIKDRRCNEDCGCRGRCSNGARDQSKETLEALKLNNAILTQLVQLSQLQGGVAIAPQGIVKSAPAAPAPAAAPAPMPVPQLAHASPPAAVASPASPAAPPSSPAPVLSVVAVPAHGGQLAAAGGNALSLPPVVQHTPQSTEYVFWDRLRMAWQNAVVGDLDLMHRLLHPQLMYEVQLTHNGQVLRFAPPGNAQAVVAFCSLFPQPPLCLVNIFPFQTAQQLNAPAGDLALSYRGPCAYQALTGSFVIQVLFELDHTFNVHLVRGISIKLEFA